MKRLSIFAILLMGACKPGTSSVLIQTVADRRLDDLVARFEIEASRDGDTAMGTIELSDAPIDLPYGAAPPASFVLRFERTVRGDVLLTVVAKSTQGRVLARGEGVVRDLRPGATAKSVVITLIGEDSLPPDGGTADMGGVDGPVMPDLAQGDGSSICHFDDNTSRFDDCVLAP